MPQAVILTDSSCTKVKYSGLLACLVRYVKEDGGTVLCACHFSSFIRPDDMAPFFAKFGLNWTVGDYTRSTMALNKGVCTPRTSAPLSPSYSQKAVFLQGVARDAAMYLPMEDSRVESAVFPPTPVKAEQTPVAFTKLDKGWLGYIGDVNAEIESDAVVLAICRL